MSRDLVYNKNQLGYGILLRVGFADYYISEHP